jgi:hypothetical protein
MKVISTDSMPAIGIHEFVVKLDGGPEKRFPKSAGIPDPLIPGNLIFEFDVTGVSVGDHTIRLGADNDWETTWGTPDPLSFTRPAPIPPFGIRLADG